MKSKQLRLLGFFLIGAIAFSINTNLEVNPYFQLYLTLLEAQGGVFLVIYLMGGLNKRFKNHRQSYKQN
jgi:hypothetical protein